MSDITALTKQLAQLKQTKRELSAAYDEKERALNKAIAVVETGVRKWMANNGTKSARTDHGLVSITTDRKYHVTDWDKLWGYMKAKDRMDLVQKRLAVGTTKEIVDEMDGELVPGTSFTDVVKVNFTKAKA